MRAFADKEEINTNLDSVKFKDLEFLKTKGGPFTTTEEVDIFMNRKEMKILVHNLIA